MWRKLRKRTQNKQREETNNTGTGELGYKMQKEQGEVIQENQLELEGEQETQQEEVRAGARNIRKKERNVDDGR